MQPINTKVRVGTRTGVVSSIRWEKRHWWKTPNSRVEYLIQFDNGGADWCPESLVMRQGMPKDEVLHGK